MKKTSSQILLNNSGFLAADFLFSFIMIIGCGIVIFALTFSLATVEVAQYITWSAARSYSAANINAAASRSAADSKFAELSKKFPLLTGAEGSSPWFVLTKKLVGDAAHDGMSGPVDRDNKSGGSTPENRHPWTGVYAELEWKLFEGIKIPFLGKIATPGSDVFKIPIRAFLLRNPSQDECLKFYNSENRFDEGIKKLEGGWNSLGNSGSYVPIEDNGC
jgi:hypothetical protein